MRLKTSQKVLIALLAAIIMITAVFGITYLLKPDVLSDIGVIVPGREPVTDDIPMTSVPGECLILSEENCNKGSALFYSDGRRASGIGFNLPSGEVTVYAPADGYVFDFWWVDPEDKENRVRAVVFTDAEDRDISVSEKETGTHSFNFNASGWVADEENKIFVHNGPIKKGEVIGIAVISDKNFFPGIFNNDHNMIMYPSIWWHDTEDGYPSDVAGYIRYFAERFNTTGQ